jgi:hypothetical protein
MTLREIKIPLNTLLELRENIQGRSKVGRRERSFASLRLRLHWIMCGFS